MMRISEVAVRMSDETVQKRTRTSVDVKSFNIFAKPQKRTSDNADGYEAMIEYEEGCDIKTRIRETAGIKSKRTY